MKELQEGDVVRICPVGTEGPLEEAVVTRVWTPSVVRVLVQRKTPEGSPRFDSIDNVCVGDALPHVGFVVAEVVPQVRESVVEEEGKVFNGQEE